MLCALLSTRREPILCVLDLSFRRWSQDCTLSFVVAEHLKTLKPGKCLQITFVSLPDSPYLCTKSTVAGPILSCLFYLLNPISQCPLTL